MNHSFLQRLRCPQSLLPLRLHHRYSYDADVLHLVSVDGRYSYPVLKHVPRFVSASNYADNFGMQWNYFSKTQLDSFSGLPISAQRFWDSTGWTADELRGKWVLDVGCGSGRFAEIALSSGAHVVALDYSSAVDACFSNLGHHPNLYIVQGDIYALPFFPGSFDFVYSLGVLQHTPDIGRAFAALPPMLVPGGKLCTDFYWKRPQTMIHMKYVLRPITTRVDQQLLFQFLQIIVPILLPISQALSGLPFLGKVLQRLIPVADYSQAYGLTQTQLNEWALLDTFDWFAPRFDNPLTKKQVKELYTKAGFNNVEVFHSGHLVGRSVKSDSFNKS